MKLQKNYSAQNNENTVSARDRIKPRGLAGLYKDRIFYDENEDIFNLAAL